eukprot:m51a1_g783 putative deoxyhypusine synthase (368) ;mRNA; f:619632-620932
MSSAEPHKGELPESLQRAVLAQSEALPVEDASHICRGFDFNKGVPSISDLLASYATTGFQATHFARAVEQVNKMLYWTPDQEKEDEEECGNTHDGPAKCRIFLGYTSNLISCGIREVIRYLVEHKLVDAIVTTAGGIEEDFIKCMAPTIMGEFHLDGATLRSKGLNRIGNLLVPNNNYCMFEDWMTPILDQLLKEQQEQGAHWTPSRIINRLGKEINNPQSVYYWAWKNDIPVFCPAITDGSIGDMIFFHQFRNPGLVVDLVPDIKAINTLAMQSRATGMVICGGGVVKHHICNANLMRNGADFSVFINTANEFDGSDAGARPDEAVSWGKIKAGSHAVKVYGEATLLFPLLVAETFAKFVAAGKTH